jgi:hypothetical protein
MVEKDFQNQTRIKLCIVPKDLRVRNELERRENKENRNNCIEKENKQ